MLRCPRDGLLFSRWRPSKITGSTSRSIPTPLSQPVSVKGRLKNAKEEKVFDALEWLAAMCSHVPNKGEQMVRYYGYYSNVSRGKRQKENQDGHIPYILEQEGSKKECRKNWARLIQKIYEVDPLTCPKCHGRMRIISFIEDEEVIKKILKHLGLWDVKARPRPGDNALPKDGPACFIKIPTLGSAYRIAFQYCYDC